MVEIEFVKRTCVNGYWILPGSRAEFATAGQAGFFIGPGNAKLVSKPKRKAKRATSSSPIVDTDSQDGAGSEASLAGKGEN